jgi:cullin 1
MQLQEIEKRATQHSNDTLLNLYIKEWDRFTGVARRTKQIFDYLDRNWVAFDRSVGRGTYYVYTLHLVLWREVVFIATHGSVMDALLRLIEKQRNGETVEQSLVKSVVDSFGEHSL